MIAQELLKSISDKVDFPLTLISAFGGIVVFILALRQKLWQKMPVYVLYVPWALATDILSLYMQQRLNGHDYYIYVKYEAMVDSVLIFAVLVELGWSVLRPVRNVLPRGTIYILAVLIGLAALAIWPFASKITPPGYYGTAATVFHQQQTAAILRIACFAVMAGFSQLLSIGWKDRELQIATGFGFYSVVSLVVGLLHLQQSPNADAFHFLDQLVSISYVGTLSYWVLNFASKEQERKEFSPQMQHLLLQLGGGARSGRIALSDLPPTRTRDKDK